MRSYRALPLNSVRPHCAGDTAVVAVAGADAVIANGIADDVAILVDGGDADVAAAAVEFAGSALEQMMAAVAAAASDVSYRC